MSCLGFEFLGEQRIRWADWSVNNPIQKFPATYFRFELQVNGKVALSPRIPDVVSYGEIV